MLVAFAIGVVVGRQAAEEPSTETPGVTGERARDPGPTRFEGEVPLGYSQSEEGAIQAAINFTRALSPGADQSVAEFRAAVAAVASNDWRDEALESTAEVEALRGDVAVVAYRVDEFATTRAQIALWIVGLLPSEQGGIQEVWGRQFIDLIWEDDDWRVAGQRGDEGPWPTPIGSASSPQDLQEALEGFQMLEYEPNSTDS